MNVYLPVFYQRKFPSYNHSYSVLNVFVVSIGGGLSSLASGYLMDKIPQLYYNRNNNSNYSNNNNNSSSDNIVVDIESFIPTSIALCGTLGGLGNVCIDM